MVDERQYDYEDRDWRALMEWMDDMQLQIARLEKQVHELEEQGCVLQWWVKTHQASTTAHRI